jgi:hypothetical protein
MLLGIRQILKTMTTGLSPTTGQETRQPLGCFSNLERTHAVLLCSSHNKEKKLRVYQNKKLQQGRDEEYLSK